VVAVIAAPRYPRAFALEAVSLSAVALPTRIRTSRLVRAPADRARAREAERETARLIERVQPYSMAAEPVLRDLLLRTDHVLDQAIPGALVECGVWRGGSSFLMAEVLKRRGAAGRTVWLFDSFEGLPPPRGIDGPAALAYAQNRDDPRYLDNCRAELAEVRAAARRLDVEELVEIVPGWFDETLPRARERIGPIALLRLDCDWYESMTTCLEQLYDQVSPGGILVIDDYYVWDGCAIALHEFLARRSLPHRIHEAAQIAWIEKTG
jgi:O-methyltransferase